MRKAGLYQSREGSGTCTYTSQRHRWALECTVTGEQVGRRSHLSMSNRAGNSDRQEASLSDRSTFGSEEVMHVYRLDTSTSTDGQARQGSGTNTDTILEIEQRNPSIE